MNKSTFTIIIGSILLVAGLGLHFAAQNIKKNKEIKIAAQLQLNNNISNFVSRLTESAELFNKSKLATRYIISKAAEASKDVGQDRDREWIFLSTLKDFDFKEYLDMAVEADTKMLLALEDFSLLYGNPDLNLSEDFKKDLVNLQTMIKENVLFIYGIDEGKLRVRDIVKWSNLINEHEPLIRDISIEIRVLEKKIK